MKKLKNYIPIAAPARRAPLDSFESALRVSLGFEPKWYYKKCDVNFTEKWHKEPKYRYKTLRNMHKKLSELFPGYSQWNEDYLGEYATISGCYGVNFMQAVFGLNIKYKKDRWPQLNHNNKLSVVEISQLEVDDLINTQIVSQLFEQMEIIENIWGKIEGYINWQGVLNNAFLIRGQKIFTDFYERPDFVHEFLSLVSKTMIKLAQKVQKKQRNSGFKIDQMSVSNCTLNMISPEIYEEFIKPYDEKIANNFRYFGVHTCNWDITPYIDVLKDLPGLGYIDMGINSDPSSTVIGKKYTPSCLTCQNGRRVQI